MSSSPTHLSVRAFTFHSWRWKEEEEETNLGIPESTLPFPAENGSEKEQGHYTTVMNKVLSTLLFVAANIFQALFIPPDHGDEEGGGGYFGKHLLATSSKPPPPTSSQKRKILVHRYRFHKLLI